MAKLNPHTALASLAWHGGWLGSGEAAKIRDREGTAGGKLNPAAEMWIE